MHEKIQDRAPSVIPEANPHMTGSQDLFCFSLGFEKVDERTDRQQACEYSYYHRLFVGRSSGSIARHRPEYFGHVPQKKFITWAGYFAKIYLFISHQNIRPKNWPPCPP